MKGILVPGADGFIDPHLVDGVGRAGTVMKECEAVLYLAALIAIPYSFHSPDTHLDTNINDAMNVREALA